MLFIVFFESLALQRLLLAKHQPQHKYNEVRSSYGDILLSIADFRIAGKEISGIMQIPRDFSSDYQVRISAKTGEGLEELQKVLQAIIRSRRILLEKVFPYSQAGRIQTIRKYGQLLEEEYQEDGIAVRAYVPAELFGRLFSD